MSFTFIDIVSAAVVSAAACKNLASLDAGRPNIQDALVPCRASVMRKSTSFGGAVSYLPCTPWAYGVHALGVRSARLGRTNVNLIY
jgi:hypothetical protein